VPAALRESAYALGATTWEVVWKVVLPYTRVGVIGGVMLGLGRALGETMAVTFVIGNAHDINLSLFMPGNTISSTLANEFTEAVTPLYTSSLLALALVLFVLTLVVLIIAPQGIIGFTAGAFGARLAGRIGVGRVLVLTTTSAAAGFLVLTQLPATGGYSPLFAAVMLIGFGTAGTAFGTMVIASGGVAKADQGVIGGVINTSRQIGAAIGAALLPAIAISVDHARASTGASGDRAAMLAGAVAAALASAVAWRARHAIPALPRRSRDTQPEQVAGPVRQLEAAR